MVCIRQFRTETADPDRVRYKQNDHRRSGRKMAKTTEARGTDQKVKSPAEAEIRAAMAKAIREVKRAADASKSTLAAAGRKSWVVPK